MQAVLHPFIIIKKEFFKWFLDISTIRSFRNRIFLRKIVEQVIEAKVEILLFSAI